ncbi:Cyclin-dependent kinase G-1 [Camellia lanceoleosa]|uniref:Cyclin-dependent kinase G-1 n=1 Tax=Camellia lanceoleosa TaxID=1840588 RepID=A0ACC0I2U1_9ERIC|nr:Cyclin-dependent kinase G-1 [Camellia lanceoleosa]
MESPRSVAKFGQWIPKNDVYVHSQILRIREEDSHLGEDFGDFLALLIIITWYNLLRRKFPATSFTGSPVLSDAGFDLLNQLLTYDPEKLIVKAVINVQRITAEDALKHEWFREVPLPKSKEFMPTFPAQHAQDRYSNPRKIW